jgi:hypothetical protein
VLDAKQDGLLAWGNTRQINDLSCGVQAPDSPLLDEATRIARMIAEEANHENTAAYFLERSLPYGDRTG